MNFWLKTLLLLAALSSLLAGCSTVSPIYGFYAHRHAVPMLGKNYEVIPEEAPQSQNLYVSTYQPVIDNAIAKIEQHRQEINSPGISAAVAIDGKLVWAGTSGWADITDNKPLTINSQFRIGSTSKALNAALLAKMVDTDNINIDTPLSTYQVGQLNDNWHNITPRQLASHMSGVPHYKDNNDWRGLLRMITLDTHYENVADSVALFDDSDVLFAPGESFEYSSLGTVLLSAVMQEKAGESYQQIMQTRVLNPLEMKHTGPEPAIARRKTETPNLVTFYWRPKGEENQSKDRKVAPWRDVDLSHRLAGGGFISTSSDLVKLGLGFNSSDFISRETREQFWTPQSLNSGAVNHQKYAIGWRVRESDFGDGIGTLFQANHGGVSRGAQSWLMVIPQYNMAVAVNINANTDEFWDFGKVSYELVKLFLQHRKTLLAG